MKVGIREDSQIDFGAPNVNPTYGGEGVSTHDVKKKIENFIKIEQF